MKRLFLLATLLLAVTITAITACRDDVVLEPPQSLVGTYEGVYIWKTGEGQQADSSYQAVIWRFTESRYFMDADTTSELYSDTVCQFCKGRGTYLVTDRVRLQPNDPNLVLFDVNCQTCNPALQPQGSYTLEQPAGGIRLSWVETREEGIVTNRIVLTKISDDPNVD